MAAVARLALLGSFSFVQRDRPVALTPSCQRLFAFLALSRTPVLRARVAGTLWPDADEQRAHGSLRTTLWRLHRSGCELIETAGSRVSITADVSVDVRETVALAHRLIAASQPLPADIERIIEELSADLLPDWYEDWVEMEREQLRHLRLHALEALSAQLLQTGRVEEAGEAALAEVAGDPLRESAHRALIRVHLAEGNLALALRRYASFRRLSGERLGVGPSQRMEELISPLTRR
jgi:DNA-binding SARP family transcriptional activator